ncbi:MAG TPA: tryptophan--tRNA ligase [Chthoniobacterales bacterium]|jgi:tryptophanyl-tRNA synthetase
MPRILTGIQPSGTLHIGNYLGAMRPAIEMQERGDAYYFIADYHALTTVRDPALLRSHVQRVALDFLACGLDPEKACLFVQSDVPGVTELSWILSTVTPMSLLEKCHSFKDKTARGIAADHGLFAYPVLMAADILLYESDLVPVGRDQKQHVEVTRDIAIKINEQYGSVFKLPTPIIRDEVATVPGLDGQKMSKSYNNAIDLFLEEKALLKKIRQMETDSTPVEAPKDPTNSSIVALYRHFASESDVTRMEADFRAGGVGYGEFKNRLFQAIWAHFEPMRQRRTEMLADAGFVERVLAEGREKAEAVASKTLQKIRSAVGLQRSH